MTIYCLYIYYNFYKFIHYLHRYYLILKYTTRSNHIVTLSTLLLTKCFYRFYNQVKEEIRMILRESPGLMNSQNKCAFCVRKIAFPVCLNKQKAVIFITAAAENRSLLLSERNLNHVAELAASHDLRSLLRVVVNDGPLGRRQRAGLLVHLILTDRFQ